MGVLMIAECALEALGFFRSPAAPKKVVKAIVREGSRVAAEWGFGIKAEAPNSYHVQIDRDDWALFYAGRDVEVAERISGLVERRLLERECYASGRVGVNLVCSADLNPGEVLVFPLFVPKGLCAEKGEDRSLAMASYSAETVTRLRLVTRFYDQGGRLIWATVTINAITPCPNRPLGLHASRDGGARHSLGTRRERTGA